MKKVIKLTQEQGYLMQQRLRLPVRPIAIVQRGPDNFVEPAQPRQPVRRS